MDPRAIIARILELPLVAAVQAVINVYGRAAGGLLARGLAFSALFAAIPTLLLVLGLVGWVAGDPEAADRLSAALVAAFPPLSGLVSNAVEALSDGAALTSILGIVGVVWTVSGLYSVLELAMARIYSDDPPRSALLRTARGLVTVGVVAGSVIALVVIGTVVALRAASVARGWPVELVATLIRSPLVLVVVTSAVVLLIYRNVPPRTPGWRAAVLPAALVGAATVVLSQVFAFLVPRLVGVAALAGSLASAFVTLTWLSLIFQALLLGAAWVRVRDDGSRALQPAGSGALEGSAAPAEPGIRGE